VKIVVVMQEKKFASSARLAVLIISHSIYSHGA